MIRPLCVRIFAAAVLSGMVASPARAQTGARAFAVEQANEQAGFMIRVDVDKPDRVYHEGEAMTVSIAAEKDCYVYLLYYDAADQITCLFPNRYQKESLVKAKVEVQVPAKGDAFRFRARAPFGDELLQVVATLRPVDLFEGKELTGSRATPLTLDEVKKAMKTVETDQEKVWAEARIAIKTVEGTAGSPGPASQSSARPQPRRLGVCVGISRFKDRRIPQLHVCHRDAEQMAAALKSRCGLEQVTLLTNEQATLGAIRKAIFEDLPKQTRPGDMVVLYFSGHGGRCPDTNGDETDGLDEYLVPYDAELGKPETRLLDDTFARWIAELSGRKVLVMLDNCYSGGSSKGFLDSQRQDIKGLDSPAGLGGQPVDFLDGELQRAKDLGQADTAILAASQADQVAWEMADGRGSVLTDFFLQALGNPKTDSNGDGRLSILELYDGIKVSVVDYVRKTFTAEQTPVLIDNAQGSIMVRP